MKLGRDRSQQICKKRRRTLFQALIGGFASGEKAAQIEGKGKETATEGKDVLITEFLISERRTNERTSRMSFYARDQKENDDVDVGGGGGDGIEKGRK